jgi:hypothetical protein
MVCLLNHMTQKNAQLWKTIVAMFTVILLMFQLCVTISALELSTVDHIMSWHHVSDHINFALLFYFQPLVCLLTMFACLLTATRSHYSTNKKCATVAQILSKESRLKMYFASSTISSQSYLSTQPLLQSEFKGPSFIFSATNHVMQCDLISGTIQPIAFFIKFDQVQHGLGCSTWPTWLSTWPQSCQFNLSFSHFWLFEKWCGCVD